jgi:hypothetical protein
MGTQQKTRFRDMSSFDQCKTVQEEQKWLKQIMGEEEWNRLFGKNEIEWQRKFEQLRISAEYHWVLRCSLRANKTMTGMRKTESLLTNIGNKYRWPDFDPEPDSDSD